MESKNIILSYLRDILEVCAQNHVCVACHSPAPNPHPLDAAQNIKTVKAYHMHLEPSPLVPSKPVWPSLRYWVLRSFVPPRCSKMGWPRYRREYNSRPSMTVCNLCTLPIKIDVQSHEPRQLSSPRSHFHLVLKIQHQTIVMSTWVSSKRMWLHLSLDPPLQFVPHVLDLLFDRLCRFASRAGNTLHA